MHKIFIAMFLICLTGFLYAQDSEVIETEATNFVLENIEGDIIELSENIGEGPILISFWATWCKPCKEELPHVQELLEKYEEQGLTVFAISTDSEKSVAKVKPYVKSHNYTFEVLLDTNSEVARSYYVRSVPFTLIIDKSGKVVYQQLGYRKGDEIKVEEVISKIIGS
jgi:cytochrome c biogenesis protein CcmG/thiol:disulfide interchange protein DsbE